MVVMYTNIKLQSQLKHGDARCHVFQELSQYLVLVSESSVSMFKLLH